MNLIKITPFARTYAAALRAAAGQADVADGLPMVAIVRGILFSARHSLYML
jgi:hypothetical protein